MATQILLIEDDESIRGNVAEMLTLHGYSVDTAANGREGIVRAFFTRPDLIICDIMMPQVDGYQVLEAVRSSRPLATVPFIFLTAKADAPDLRRGMAAGADDYLTKPFSSVDLLSAIQSRLDQERRRSAALQAQLDKHARQLNSVSAHEYNTPLTGILGFAHLLRDSYDEFSKEEVQSMLDMVISSCLRLKRTLDNRRLAEDLLGARLRVDSGLVPRSARLSAELVRQVLQACCSQHQRWVESQVDIEPAQVRIWPEHLEKILEELIDNAVKFSPATDAIQLKGQLMEGAYAFTVVNQGRGLTADEIDRIGPYTQFGRSVQEQQGSGLGLFITRQLVALHQGFFSISSQRDEPTSVTIRLPLYSEPCSEFR